MRNLIRVSLLAVTAAAMMVVTPSLTQADDYWDGYWKWYKNDYSGYYNRRYDRDYHRRGDVRFRYDPYYNQYYNRGYYYDNDYYYRHGRRGNSIDVGPLHLRWR